MPSPLHSSSPEGPIAIIGSGCRFPGATSTPSKLWDLLREPQDVVRDFDPKRFNLARFYHPDGETHGSTDVKGRSYLLQEDNRVFDAGFFAISPVEAMGMDPQQRLLLEVTYEACEAAGVTLDQLRGSLTSVHVGVMSNDYSVIQARDTETLPKYNATGTANSILSNRVSYVFDLKGPSATIDTACSSSLVALHHAVQGLRHGDSDMAVVGGTNLIFESTPYIAESKLHMLSPDSQSRMWDKTANGYARGEGIAALLLKPLSAALRDGDHVEGVIRATGVNSDGQSPGITMPFAPAQTELIRRTYRRAGLDPLRDPPQYFECHGTGTQAGDPVEARAVFDAFYRDSETGKVKAEPQSLHVGSVKTVIGHLEGCAGLAGVIKVLLALKHRTIPPNMLFNELNPKIAPYYGPGALLIPTAAIPWPEVPAGSPLRASVNSFGFGGTNAHAIIESLPNPADIDVVAKCAVEADSSGGVSGPLVFSARSGQALLRIIKAYLAHLERLQNTAKNIDLRDLSWLLQTRRTFHRVRTFFIGESEQDVLDSMVKFVAIHDKVAKGEIGSSPRLVNPNEAPGVLGVFTGQGAQWPTMGRGLLKASPLFRRSLEACEAVLRDNLLPGHAPEWSLIEELTKEASDSRLLKAELSQPLCTALQLAQVDMLSAAGIKLHAAVGHSSGEIAAAYAAGIITRKAAMQIAYYRGYYAHMAQGANGERGGMIAVGLSLDAALAFCQQPAFLGRLVVAASNAPQSCTLSGDLDAVVEAKVQLDRDNIFARQLQVDTAYHSHHMDACASAYLQSLLACDIQLTAPTPGACIWNSSVRGDTRLLLPGGALDSLKGPYWIANMVQTVKFSQAIESSIWHGGPYDLAIELGPHPALKGPTEQTLKAVYGAVPRYTGLLKRNSSDVEAFQTAIGQVWSQLGPYYVDFAGYRNSFYNSSPPPPKVITGLPVYAWDHDQVFWRESRTSMRYRTMLDTGHELLGRRVADDNDRELRWRNVLKLNEMSWLRGHEVLQEVLLPGAAYVSIPAQAAQYLAAASGRPISQLVVEDVDILRPVVVPDNKDGVETLFTVQILTNKPSSDRTQAVIRARFSYYVCQTEATGAMIHTSSGTLVIHLGQVSGEIFPPREPTPQNVVNIQSEPIYDMFRGIGLNYQGAFNAIAESQRCLGFATATGVWPANSLGTEYILHPAVLDVAFQSLFIAHVHPSSKQMNSALLPSHLDRVIIDPRVPISQANAATSCIFDAWVVSASGTALDGDINIIDAASGRTLVQVEGLYTRSAGGQDASLDKRLFLKTVHGQDASTALALPLPSSTDDASATIDCAIGQLLEQITFKFPRCKMLEIGAGEGRTTWSVLSAIDSMYDSYTYTDPSADVLSSAADTFSGFDRMIYKMLDLGGDVNAQGFTQSSYDIVIVNYMISTSVNPESLLRNTRALLRAGGFLILCAKTGDQSKLSMGEWHRLLRRSGYSGADTIFSDNEDESHHVNSCIVSRAVNDDLLRLLNPLTFVAGLPAPTAPVLVIGGCRLNSIRLIDEFEKLLPHAWQSQVRIVASIDELEEADLASTMDILCLQDLDEAFFAKLPIQEARLRKLQQLLMSAKHLLWVTTAGKSYTPRASMIRGIARVAPVELPHLSMQVLGLEVGARPASNARHCFEALLRLWHMDELKTQGQSDMMWIVEPEYEVLADGTVKIPRVMPDTDLDERYNAKTRPVLKTIDATNVAVHAFAPEGASKMMLQAVEDGSSPLEERIAVQVEYSIHVPSQNGQTLYLVCGQHAEGGCVMALSRTNASRIFLRSEEVVVVDASLCTPGGLASILSVLLRRAVINEAHASKTATVLLREPLPQMAAQIEAELARNGLRVYCVSSRTDIDIPGTWIRIHANMSKRMIKQCLPRDVGLFVDCSAPGPETHVGEHVRACLPPTCTTWNTNAQLLLNALRDDRTSLAILLGDVGNAEVEGSPHNIIAAADLAGADAGTLARQQYITDWTQRHALPLTIKPLNSSGMLRPDRTYLIAGGSGGLGLSICQWMIRQGAKHLVVTSRNPKIDAGLEKDAQRAGASVHMLALDATRRDDVVAAVSKIRETMPPIAGVCNFSMVLNDKMILDMSAEQLNGTLHAKVIGTEILDDIFSDANQPPLDFFILTSSTASTVGNVGQANYHAANLFMAAVVEHRRSRGLAASVVHIGWVADTGYVTRSDRYHLLEEHFRSMRFIPLSETDVQDAFGQAVRAGKPQGASNRRLAAGSYDITMGLDPPTEPMQPNQTSKALWVSNPRLMSLQPYSALSSSQQQHPGRLSSNSVPQQLEEAETEEASVAIVSAAFGAKLETILQLPAGSVHESLERPLIDLGIDSLVAVEIRTWFLKELDVEVPVVKLLGGDTILQICTLATKKLLGDILKRKANEPVEAQEDKAQKEKARSPAAQPAAVPAPVPAPVPAATPKVVPAPPFIATVVSAPSDSSRSGPSGSTGSTEECRSLKVTADSLMLSTPTSAQTSGFTTRDVTPASSMVGSSEPSEPSSEPSSECDMDDKATSDDLGAVKPVVIREAPMSAAQSRIWFVSKHLDDPAGYNTAFHYRVGGPVSIARLQRALRLVVNHHESLRTCFYPRLDDGHPMQGIIATSAFELTHTENATDATLRKTLSQFKTRVWDLEKGRTMAVALLSRTATEFDFVIGYHHILMDGWSLALFLRDLDRAYQLQPLEESDGLSYVDYSIHQLAEEKTGVLNEDLAFWRAEFDTVPDTLPLLPMARGLDRSALTRSETQENGSHYVDRELSPGQLAAQKAICKRLRISPFHLHLALLQVLLARMAGIEDVCIGVVDANRRDERFTQTVGCFVNMLPLRSCVPSTATFADVAVTASRKAMEVFAHGTVPFDRILDQTQAPRVSGTNPLFQAAINYRAAVGGMDMWNLPLGSECRMQLSTEEAKEAENPYDLSLGFIETQTGCLVQLFGLASLYSQDACDQLLGTYLRLLETVDQDPQVSVADLALHDPARVADALKLGKGPEMEFSWPKTLSQRVQDICLLHPAQTAITDVSEKLSYSQLAVRVDRVVHKILKAGVAEKRVAVLCEPTIDSIVAMLAILKAGSVYVPLDTSLPASRHADMMRVCAPALILYHAHTTERVRDLIREFPSVQPVLVDVDDDDGPLEARVSIATEADTPAVVLFTSGSTGTPKGIVLTQANFVNHIALKTHVMGLQQETVLQQSSLGFDMSLIQIFSALANGGHLVIAHSNIRRDPVELVKLMRRESVSFTIATPTEYLAWVHSDGEVLQENRAWRFAFSGGEQVPRQLKLDLRRLGLPGLQLVNCYGPTEITAAATFHSVALQDETNSCLAHGASGFWNDHVVGKALPNYSVCVVDAAGHAQPVGHTGEICIGGAGVALGYLNQPEQTKAKFVGDVMADGSNSRRIMYRTGDKGRLLSDGTLLCLGRLDGDTQIKLRGQRIELQEVESALLQASDGAFASAVVSVRGQVLVAHVTLSNPDASLNDSDLADILARVKLPQAFVPATIRVLPAMPLTSNGKMDRKAIASLPLADKKESGVTKPVEKMTIREGELRLLWERVLPALGDIRLGPSSDFFLCGGNSLLLMKLQKAIKETTGVVVTTKQLYEATTLRAMTHCVFNKGADATAQDQDSIDWAVETAVPDWLQEQVQRLEMEGSFETVNSSSEAIEVLLTGGTSFLGGHLLSSLLQANSVKRVHCVAVPGDELSKLPQDPRVVAYTGSLLSPTLGLTPEERKTLEQTIHVIVHAGANGHCLNRFDTLRAPNLHSLHFLASLALPRSVPLLFLSSSRATLLSGSTTPKAVSLQAFEPAADGKDGYTASKWAGEVFLEKLVAHLQTTHASLAVAIHRPCTLVSEHAPNSDAMNGILRYSQSMRCAPRLENAQGYLDFGPLDTIIGEITAAALDLATTPQADGAKAPVIRFRHHSGGIKTPFSQFRTHLEKYFGGAFDEMDMEDWLVRAGQAGLDPLIVAYIEAILEGGKPMISPFMGESQ